MNQRIHAYIFARGGSVRLPKKNLRILNGKSLIAHAIAAAKGSRFIDKVYVSTDCMEIAYEANKHGADVIERPPALAQGEPGSEWRAWRHALDIAPCDIFVSVPAVCPLRSVQDIDNTIEALEAFDACVTVTPVIMHPFGDPSMRSQDRRPVMNVCSVCYAVKAHHIRHGKDLWDGSINSVEVPKQRAVDIDDEFDFKVAEALFNRG